MKKIEDQLEDITEYVDKRIKKSYNATVIQQLQIFEASVTACVRSAEQQLGYGLNPTATPIP